MDRDIYAASCDGMVVFLDLAKDRYCALPGAEAGKLLAVLEGHGDAAQCVEAQSTLVEAGLCATPRQKVLRLTPPARASRTLEPTRKAPAPWTAISALYARMRADALLANDGWAEIVRRREARMRRGGAPLERVLRASQMFETSSAYARKEGACLERALALILFLGPLAAHVDWIFAVRGLPFSAHCWVQCQDVVLNESVEQALVYTPILVA